jgi:hypothetical protein
MRWTISLLVVFSCAGYAQEDPIAACLERIVGDKRFASIRGKVALGDAADTTFAMYSNESFASKADRAAIAGWSEARVGCAKAGDSHGQKERGPLTAAFILEGEHALVALAVELYHRRISYAEFNKRRQAAADNIRRQLAMAQRAKAREPAWELNTRTLRAPDEAAAPQPAFGNLLIQMRPDNPAAPRQSR